jgi:hypothetical protein
MLLLNQERMPMLVLNLINNPDMNQLLEAPSAGTLKAAELASRILALIQLDLAL